MQDKKVEQLERQKENLTFWLVAIVTTMISFVGLYVCVYHWKTDDQFLREVRQALIGAFATTGFFGVFFSVLSRTDYVGVIRRAIIALAGGDPEILKKFSPRVRSLFVANSLKATLGQDVGSAVYSSLVKPLMSNSAGYRREHRYHAKFSDEMPQFESLNPTSNAVKKVVELLNDNQGEYLWVSEHFQYERYIASEDLTYKGEFNICFAMNRDAPQVHLLGVVFFRGILELDEQLSNHLADMNESEIEEFVRTVLCLRVVEFRTKTPLKYRVREVRSSEFGIVYVVTSESFGHIESARGISITFMSPHHRSIPSFAMMLPQPTENAEIHFERARSMKRIIPVQFLPNIDQSRIQRTEYTDFNGEISAFKINVDGWAFPVSGIVFNWRYRNLES
ncbi:MAG: hypothetical protein AAFQ85_01265 [Pseudomonadota bacterium]